MKENLIHSSGTKGKNESHFLLESENLAEADAMATPEFVKMLTNYIHCLDFVLSKGKEITDPVKLEVKKITYNEEIENIHKLVDYLVEKKLQNKPKVDFTAL